MFKKRQEFFAAEQKLYVYRGVLFLAVSICVLLTVLVGIVWPTWQKKQIMEKEIQLKQQKIETLESFAQKCADYEKILADVRKRHEELQKQLPASIENTGLLTRLENLAKQSQVVLATTKMLEPQSSIKDVQSLGVELKARGSYLNCITFLESLEKESVTGLEQLQIEGNNLGVLTIKGQFRQYILL